jgi:hypothetical protein
MTPEGRRARGATLVWLAFCLPLAACASGFGTIPRVTAFPAETGYKLLRPAAVAVACESGFFRGAASDDLLARTTADLLARDTEADAIVQAKIEWTGWSIGVYGRRCVRVEGDVVRSVRTILLPMAGDAHRHHGH